MPNAVITSRAAAALPDPDDPYVAAITRALPGDWELLSWFTDDG